MQYAPVYVLCIQSSKQPNITSSTELNSVEIGLKMGHSTGLNDLLCTAVKLFIYCYHIN